MADFVSKLKLDASGFVKGVKVAAAASSDLEKPIDVEVNADASGALKSFKELEKQAKEKISGIEDALRDMAVSGGAGTEKFKALQDQLKAARAEAQNLAEAAKAIEPTPDSQKGFAGIADKIKGIGASLGGGEGGIGGGIANVVGLGGAFAGATAAIGAAQAVISSVAGALADVYNQGAEANQALKDLSLSTGATGDELANLEAQAKTAFQKGVGESVAEAVKTVGELRKALGGSVPDDVLGDVAAKASKVGKVLGIETPDLINKVSPLIKQYGKSFDEALNLVSSATQQGVQDVGGYVDAIQEFTPNAKEAGLSAEEFAGRLALASKAGVKDLAKVGDGYKELNNRIKSGDLTTQLTGFSGALGEQLRGIVKLGEEGTKSLADVQKESIAAINKARETGQISEKQRGQLFTTFGGSIAEDLGTELYSKVFSAPIDTNAVKAAADKAGQTIKTQIQQQDPLESLSRGFELVTTSIGQGLQNLYKQVIVPLTQPIIELFTSVKESFTAAFSGEGVGNGLSSFIGTIGEVFKGLVSGVIAPVKLALQTIATIVGTVFQTVKDAISPIIDAFQNLFAEFDTGGESVDVFGTVVSALGDALGFVGKTIVNVLLLPMRAIAKVIQVLVEGVTGAVKWVKEVAKTFGEWLLSIQPVRDAIAGVIEFITSLISKIGEIKDGVAAFLGLGSDEPAKAVGKTAEELAKAAKAAKDTAGETENIGNAAKNAVKDVNTLAGEFNNALAAAQATTTNFIAAAAQARAQGNAELAKSLDEQAAKAAAAQRKLEQAQDLSAAQTDPNRRRALREAAANDAQATLKQQELLNAQLIVNTRQREQAILDIEQKYARLALNEQIKTAQAAVRAGGAGLPEAQRQLADLNSELVRQTKEANQQQIELRRRYFDEDLQLTIDRETARRDAALKIAATTQELLQRQLNFGNTSTDNIQRIADLAVQTVKTQAEAEARAFIESTNAFQKGKEEIIFKSKVDGRSVEETQKAIDALAKNLTRAYVDANNDPELKTEFTQSLVDIFTKGERAATDAQLQVFRDARAKRISLMQDASLKERATAIEALVNERDDLLRNETLTEEKRLAIKKEFAKRINKVLDGQGTFRTLAENAGAAFSNLQFTIEGLGKDSEDTAKKIEDINKALRDGEITYQEAVKQLSALEAQGTGVLAAIGQIAQQITSTIASTTSDFAKGQIASLAQVQKEFVELQNNGLATTLEIGQKEEELNKKREETYAAVGIAAGAAFVEAIASGEDAGKALIKFSLDTLDALIPILSAQIAGVMFASPASGATLGTAGLAATAVLTGILKGLVAAAKAGAGFEQGGYTGDIGRKQVAGVVHGREFVSNADTVRDPVNRSLLQFMQDKKGNALDWARLNSPNVTVSMMDTSTMVATEIGSLRGEFAGLRSDVQALGVEINRNVTVQGSFVAKGSDLRAIVNIERRKQQLRGAR